MLPSSLDPVRTFLVVARELHFSRAAQALHLSQPAVTQHIRRLESDLGAPLFSRHSRRVELTAAGRRFAARMSDLMAAMDDAAAELTDPTLGRSPLRLAYTPMAVALREPLRAAGRAAGALAVISEAWEADLLADLRTGRLAVVAGHALPTGPDITARYVLDDPLRVLLGDETPGPPVQLAALRNRELLHGPPELAPRWHQRITDLVRAATGRDLRGRLFPTTSATWLEDLRQALSVEETFALVPASSVPPSVVARGLDPPVSVPLLLAWLSTTVRDDALRTVRALRATPGGA